MSRSLRLAGFAAGTALSATLVAPTAAALVDPVPGPALTGTVDRTLTDERITESSGLAVSARFPGVVLTHNDSDDDPIIYAVDRSGRTVAWTLPEAPARDWEAMARFQRPDGGSDLWVGDIGDNLSSWESVRLLRAEEPDAFADAELPWTRYDVTFPDEPRNAEALLADPSDGQLFIVTKEATDPGVYRVPSLREGEPVVLQRIADAPAGITDGAISASGRIVLVDYVYAWFADDWAGPWTRQALPFQVQRESVAWLDDDTILVGTEGANSQLLAVDVNATPTEAAPTSSSASATLPADPSESAFPGWAPLAVGGAVALLVGVGLALRR